MPNKILELQQLKQVIDTLKREGKTIVLTNGCFDILHVGHTRYLQAAKKLGDVLIAAINSDESVRKLKQEGRPIMPQDERAEVLSSLETVDYVVIFDEANPEKIISEIRPDIHVKGGDYAKKKIPESELVKSLGGKTVVLEEAKGKSTTRIIEKILDTYGRQR